MHRKVPVLNNFSRSLGRTKKSAKQQNPL